MYFYAYFDVLFFASSNFYITLYYCKREKILIIFGNLILRTNDKYLSIYYIDFSISTKSNNISDY